MSDSRVVSTLRDITIESVATRTVGANNSTIWDIKTQGGPSVSTFKAPIGNAAKTIWENNQVADMQVTIEQKGDYTNYLLDKIQVSKSSATTPVGHAMVNAQEAQDLSFEKFAEAEREKRAHTDATNAQRDLSIHRQVAAKVAAALGPADAGEFWNNVGLLVNFFQTGDTPFSSVTSHTDVQGADDDIPF